MSRNNENNSNLSKRIFLVSFIYLFILHFLDLAAIENFVFYMDFSKIHLITPLIIHLIIPVLQTICGEMSFFPFSENVSWMSAAILTSLLQKNLRVLFTWNSFA